MPSGKKRILVLYWHPGPSELRVAIHRHLHVMDWSRHRHEILYYNAVDGAPRWLRRGKFDVVVLHTTLLCLRWSHHFSTLKWKLRWIAELNSTKIAMPQDEYDHAWTLDEWLYELNVSVVFTVFGEAHRHALYPIMHERAVFHKCLTGYIDDGDVQRMSGRLKSHKDRRLDVVYRASHLPYWFGRQGQLKHRVADMVVAEAEKEGIRYDISTEVEDTIVGTKWLEFLASGRAVIGSESGSSVLDRRGEIRAKIQTLCNARPCLSFDEVSRAMPAGWDDYRFFAVSPRHFEAVFTKTAQVLVEGQYDNILEPGRHYLSLKHDFSNLSDIFTQLGDRRAIEAMAEAAYVDVCQSGRFSYKCFADQIDGAIEKEVGFSLVAPRFASPVRKCLPWAALSLFGTLSEKSGLLRYRLTRQMIQSSSHWWILRHPVVCLAKVVLAIKLIWGNMLTREMFVYYLSTRKLRNHLSLHRFVSDLLTFRLLQEVQDGRVSTDSDMHVETHYDRTSEALVFFTRPGLESTSPSQCQKNRPALPSSSSRPRSVVWDHSVIGRQVLCPFIASKRLAFQIGSYGTHSFETLGVVIRSLPDGLWERLCRTFRTKDRHQ